MSTFLARKFTRQEGIYMPIDNLFRDAGVHLDWQYIVSYALLLAPAVVPGVLFIYSFIKEPRQFRNALFFVCDSGVVLDSSGTDIGQSYSWHNSDFYCYANSYPNYYIFAD